MNDHNGDDAGHRPASGAPETSNRAAQDEILLTALAAGQHYVEAGRTAGLSERTVRRRMHEPDFAAEVARRRALHVSNVTGSLLASASRAVDVILECLDSEKPADRLRAAELMLTLMRRFHADADFEARLAALEAVSTLGTGVQNADE